MKIDLTVKIDESLPVYPGDPKTVIKPAGILEKDGFQDHYLSIGTHVGTHIDAPCHMIKGGKSLDQISIDKFFGKGIYIKTDREITLDKFKSAKIEENSIVLIGTGMSDVYHDEKYFENYPAIPEEVAQYLVERKIKMIGVDMCSVDYEPFPIHKILLQSEILIIENLINLSRLQSKDFKVYALPIRLPIDGAPARVIAETI